MKLHTTITTTPRREIALHAARGVSPIVSRQGNLWFICFDHTGKAIVEIAS
jgi:hypothetical protein